MRIVITAGRVLRGPVGEILEDAAVVVEGGVIAAVGARAEVGASGAAVRIERPEATVLPGLINPHVHLAFEPGADHGERLRTVGDAELVLSMARHARELLDGGVTTARDLGDRGNLALGVRDAIAAGDLAGPRVLAAGTPLTVPGGHCWFLGGAVEPGELAARVRELAAAGVDVVKVMASGGQITAGGAAMWEPQFGAAELRTVVDEAHRAGLPVAVHAHGADSIADAVAAGADTIEHCTWMAGPGASDFRTDVAERMAAAGIVASAGSTGNGRMLAGRVPDERIAELFGRLRRMADLGVRVILGSDAGLTPFTGYGEVLRNWSDWGFGAAEIIEMATSGAADALGLGSTTGRLTPGLSADLIAVDGDPLADLTALTHVDTVIAAGRIHRA